MTVSATQTGGSSRSTRRRFLILGAGSAALLAMGGGAALMLKPAWNGAQLSGDARQLLRAVGTAVLAGTLPAAGPARELALQGMLLRVETLVAALPAHAQAELAQLLALLSTSPGRRLLADLSPTWHEASVAEVQTAMQNMRVSNLSLKQQAYHGLHDVVAGAYFSDASTWAIMGYPGPLKIS
jgi:hypothetical protein